MGNLDWLVKAAALAIAIYGALNALSLILVVINPRSIRCWFGDALARDETISRSQALKERLQELESLGFSLLGVKHEKMPFWGKHAREIATASPEAGTFGSVVLTGNGEPFIVYCYTPFLTGGMVYTRQQSNLPQLESQNISVKNIASNSLNDLFSSHQARVEAFKQKGLNPLAVGCQEARIEATYSFYTSNYAKKIMAFSALLILLPYLLVALSLLFIYRK